MSVDASITGSVPPRQAPKLAMQERDELFDRLRHPRLGSPDRHRPGKGCTYTSSRPDSSLT
jgi:hypothetical protein